LRIPQRFRRLSSIGFYTAAAFESMADDRTPINLAGEGEGDFTCRKSGQQEHEKSLRPNV
jgi:hypothetical protein